MAGSFLRGLGERLVSAVRRSRLSIGTRLLLAFLTVIALTGLVALVAIDRFSELSSAAGFVAGQEVQEIHKLSALRTAIAEAETHLLHLILGHEDWDAHLRHLEQRRQAMEALFRDYAALHAEMAAEEARLLGDVETAYRRYRDGLFRAVDLVQRGDRSAAEAFLLTEGDALRERLGSALELLVAWEAAETSAAGTAARASALAGRNIVTALTVCAAVGSLVMAFVITASITGPVRQLVAATERAQRGDLRSRTEVTGGDEISLLANRFDEMIASLRGTFEQQRRFFTSASHELRTPLTIIKGEAEVTLRRPDMPTDEYSETLSRIVAIADQMGRFVDELLFLARSEAGQIQYEMAVVELTSVLEEAHDQIRGLALLKGVNLKLDAKGHAAVEGDAGRLRQLFLILLDNAVKYTPAGGTVTIRLEAASDSVEVDVADTGVGIPADDLPHVFERFYRAKTGGRLGAEGAGLGLSIAESIAKAHGGEIGVRSKLGVGTTFTVAFQSLEQPIASRIDASAADRRR